MLKIIAVLFFATIATVANATQPVSKNPCLPGYQWYPDKRECGRLIEDAKPIVAKCTPGSTQQVKRGKHMITQTCGFVK